MIHTVIIPDSNTIKLSIPENYIGKEVEVIAFSKEEGLQREELSKKKALFTILHVDDKKFRFNRDEANER